jgi:hypothetical protein
LPFVFIASAAGTITQPTGEVLNMRLVNSSTHKLEEFSGQVPEYAILSHTWETNELSFQDIHEHSAKHMAGFAKVEGCCAQAKRDGFDYIWIDTCCIDKASSAELSEAINSMYRWYREAQVCYAYLADVPSGENLQNSDSPFAKSRWFTRGWTLQELIAPSSLVFYGIDWHEIGTKMSLQKLVSAITGIPISVLKFGDIENFSVAQRMSWASERETTRLEDKAYCLMGLFSVNMPMLYGEGERAFRRLQEEIMKTSDDHTLFAWTEARVERCWITRGLLADSSLDFVDSGHIIRSQPVLKSAPYSMTNKGLRIELPLFPTGDQVYFAVLNCHLSSNESNAGDLLGIYLKQVSFGKEKYFARIFTDCIDAVPKEKVDKCERKTVYIIHKNVAEDPSPQELGLPRPFRISTVMEQSGAKDGYYVSGFYSSFSESRMLEDGCFRFVGRQTGVLGVLKVKHQIAEDFVVVLGRQEGLPWCDIETGVGNRSLVRICDTYRVDTHENRLDRIAKSLQSGMLVSLAIRKKGKKQRISEENYDGEYALCISVHADSDKKVIRN